MTLSRNVVDHARSLTLPLPVSSTESAALTYRDRSTQEERNDEHDMSPGCEKRRDTWNENEEEELSLARCRNAGSALPDLGGMLTGGPVFATGLEAQSGKPVPNVNGPMNSCLLREGGSEPERVKGNLPPEIS